MSAEEQALKIETEMVNANLKFDRDDSQERIRIQLVFGGGDFSYEHVVFHIIIDEDGTGAHVVSSPIVSVQTDRYAQLLSACNECNTTYRWAKFYIDEDSDLMVECDVPLRDSSVGDECVEVVMRLADIVDQAYATIMRAAWGN